MTIQPYICRFLYKKTIIEALDSLFPNNPSPLLRSNWIRICRTLFIISEQPDDKKKQDFDPATFVITNQMLRMLEDIFGVFKAQFLSNVRSFTSIPIRPLLVLLLRESLSLCLKL